MSNLKSKAVGTGKKKKNVPEEVYNRGVKALRSMKVKHCKYTGEEFTGSHQWEGDHTVSGRNDDYQLIGLMRNKMKGQGKLFSSRENMLKMYKEFTVFKKRASHPDRVMRLIKYLVRNYIRTDSDPTPLPNTTIIEWKDGHMITHR